MFERLLDKTIYNSNLEDKLAKVLRHPSVKINCSNGEYSYYDERIYEDDRIKVISVTQEGHTFTKGNVSYKELYYNGKLIYKTYECDKSRKYTKYLACLDDIIDEALIDEANKKVLFKKENERRELAAKIREAAESICYYYTCLSYEDDYIRIYKEKKERYNSYEGYEQYYVYKIELSTGEVVFDNGVFRKGKWCDYIIEIGNEAKRLLDEKRRREKELEEKRDRLEKEKAKLKKEFNNSDINDYDLFYDNNSLKK